MSTPPATPQTIDAPERSARRRNKAQPPRPALSARHISPLTPPSAASRISTQSGISVSVCGSLPMGPSLAGSAGHVRTNVFPGNKKPGARAGFRCFTSASLGTHLYKNDYFLPPDSQPGNAFSTIHCNRRETHHDMRVIYRPGNLRQASGQANTHFRYGKPGID